MAASTTKRKTTKKKTEKKKLYCYYFREEFTEDKFYLTNSNIFKQDGHMMLCKDALVDIYNKYLESFNDIRLAVELVCMKTDTYYHDDIFDMAEEQAKKQNSIVIKTYMQKANSLHQYKGTNWDTTVNDRMKQKEKSAKFLAIENQKRIQEEKAKRKEIEKQQLKFSNEDYEDLITQQDLKNQQDVEDILGYDPFLGLDTSSRKFLYSAIMPYLEDDETLQDAYKIDAIKQILINSAQIKYMDNLISNFKSNPKEFMNNLDDIKNLTKIKNDLSNANDKLSKENSIAVKHRKGDKSNKTGIGAVMKKCNIKGFEDVQVSFYEQKKSIGYKHACDISFKALLDQIKLDDKDTQDIINKQREKIHEMEDKILDLEEELRLLYAKGDSDD